MVLTDLLRIRKNATLSFMTLISFIVCFALSFFIAACEPSVPPGKIRIKNDSQDREYNTVNVSGGGMSCRLSPGEFCNLPKGTRTINFTRKYKEYTRYYVVECPPLGEKGITMKLIDVHLNRISGGCKTVSGGKS